MSFFLPSTKSQMSSSLSCVLFLILLLVVPTLSSRRHVITIPSSSLRPSSLAWDPSAQHFLVSSRDSVSSVSDAGVIQTLLTLTLTPADSASITAVAIDGPNRRLVVASPSPSSVAAYDLRSPQPHPQLFSSSSFSSSPLPDRITSLAVDPSSGSTFISVPNSIFVSDRDGNVSLLSKSPILEEIVGISFSTRGFLLAAGRHGKVFKVDSEDGATKEVILSGKLPADTLAIAAKRDGSAVVAGRSGVARLRSGDGWAEAGVEDEAKAEVGEKVYGAAVREGKREYLLVGPDHQEGSTGAASASAGDWRIEEVEWPRDGEGDMVWGMVLLGLGLAYFLYWRFQMGQLVSSVNKKRA
ncbi:uncharacterized protein M6B38_372190 [Iris pallida]|uniref:Uncharacterized protein n=1 Tax=Iris pallida TaxID=29817 RepID=A0AAX6GBW6_IRIPA|nr:uncharacterized protein M6B38_372190 [Iris pallida]